MTAIAAPICSRQRIGRLDELSDDTPVAIRKGRIEFGVLAVSPDSSRTVTLQVEQDLCLMMSDRFDITRRMAPTNLKLLVTAGVRPRSKRMSSN